MTPRSSGVSDVRTGSACPRSVLVIGASGGIGRAICHAFARIGCSMGIHYHREKASADRLLKEVAEDGGSGALYQADVRDAESVQHMVGVFSRDHPRPIGFVCAAGIASGRLVLTLRDDEWENMIATNLTGVFHCLRAMASPLQVQGGGSIVVVGSYTGYQGMVGQAAYSASKAGVIGLVQTAALEWGRDNICVNVLWPGWHLTKLSGAGIARQDARRDHALGRPPALDEVVRTVVHLAQVKDVSGQVWNCDSRSVSL